MQFAHKPRFYTRRLNPTATQTIRRKESPERPKKKLRRFFIKDQNFMMQDRVNDHLLFCKPSSLNT